MRTPLTAFSLLLFFFASAQKREEVFNFSFKPSNSGPYYYVVTEKKDSGWHREAYFISQMAMAMEGWYKDEACNLAHGPVKWFHPTRVLKSTGRYVNGKKEGLWLGFDDQGNLIDSSTYHDGYLTGVSFRWHSNGMAKDSLDFDGQGNGVQVSWYDDGNLASAGRWTADTVKKDRWKYFHKNGTVMATEDYVNGKLVTCNCYTEAGQALDTADCREKEALPSGGIKGWQRFLASGLQQLLNSKAASREWSAGQRTVAIRFVVEKDGSLSEFKPLTQYGRGLEEEIIKLLQRSPRWTPGQQWGRPVRSYHTQPLTFVIE